MSIFLSNLLFCMTRLLVVVVVVVVVIIIIIIIIIIIVSNSIRTKFLGVTTGNTLSWKAHTDHLLPKLCMACYSIGTIKTFMLSRKSEVNIIFIFSIPNDLRNNLLWQLYS